LKPKHFSASTAQNQRIAIELFPIFSSAQIELSQVLKTIDQERCAPASGS
jgi:hypothetical protein